MKRWGIWVILLLMLGGCSAQPAGEEIFQTLTESDRYFMEGKDYRVILTDLSLQEIEQYYRQKYAHRFQMDERTDNALFFTLRADHLYRIAVTPNDLDNQKGQAILITIDEQ